MISIVIVNYNSENFLEQCLGSIQNSNLENRLQVIEESVKKKLLNF